MTTVREIVETYLRDHGHDGLCYEECGCGLDDLFPCGCDGHECVTAKRVKGVDGDMIYVPAADSIQAAYKRFKHLDGLVSDLSDSDDPFRHMLYRVWQAVKSECEKKE